MRRGGKNLGYSWALLMVEWYLGSTWVRPEKIIGIKYANMESPNQSKVAVPVGSAELN